MANTTLETALVPSGFTLVLKTFFETWVAALQHLYRTKYSETEALELAEATVQDIEGGLMLMKLYRDKKYLLNALKRSESRLDE